MVKLTVVLTRVVMSYCLVANNQYSSRCPTADMCFWVNWLEGQCVMHYNYRYQCMVCIPFGL